LGKPYGIKPRCSWEHLEECTWEHDENTSIWAQGGKKKTKNPSLFFKNQKIGPFMSA
jgi:hypothetical protein